MLKMLPFIMLNKFAQATAIEKSTGFRLLLKCLDISNIILAPKINCAWLAHWRTLIIEHHQLVKLLSPSAVRLKFHFLVHYSLAIQVYGPPIHYFTMRFESLH